MARLFITMTHGLWFNSPEDSPTMIYCHPSLVHSQKLTHSFIFEKSIQLFLQRWDCNSTCDGVLFFFFKSIANRLHEPTNKTGNLYLIMVTCEEIKITYVYIQLVFNNYSKYWLHSGFQAWDRARKHLLTHHYIDLVQKGMSVIISSAFCSFSSKDVDIIMLSFILTTPVFCLKTLTSWWSQYSSKNLIFWISHVRWFFSFHLIVCHSVRNTIPLNNVIIELALTFNPKCICLKGIDLSLIIKSLQNLFLWLFQHIVFQKSKSSISNFPSDYEKQLSGRGDSKENVNLQFKIKNKMIIHGNQSFLFLLPTLQSSLGKMEWGPELW